jgi:hypothetical protein
MNILPNPPVIDTQQASAIGKSFLAEFVRTVLPNSIWLSLPTYSPLLLNMEITKLAINEGHIWKTIIPSVFALVSGQNPRIFVIRDVVGFWDIVKPIRELVSFEGA